MGTVKISKGNSKLGAIPSVSLPSIKTCRNCACQEKCYAQKLERLRPAVRNAYQHNLEVWIKDPETYWREVEASIMMSRFFRFHVSGDIPSFKYLINMVEIARRQPHCEILCFTKKYNLVNELIEQGGELPGNLHMIFSGWVSLEMANPFSLPEAHMVFTMTRPLLEKSGRKSIITTALEHKSVIRPTQRLSDDGFNVVYLGVDSRYTPIPKDLWHHLRAEPGLVSVMFVNNEIRHSNDVNAIGRLCKDYGALFHTDCVQAASMHPINVERIGCDFATISAHKIHGPKGVGALFVKDKSLFEPMILGGAGQEFGMRGGTENVAGIVGFGKACELMVEANTLAELELIEMMQDSFMFVMGDTISKAGFGRPWQLNGSSEYVTKTLSIRVDGIDAESLILMADNAGVCISAGSACNSIEHTPSHVLTAIGLSAEQAKSSFRVSFSRMNTIEEATEAGKIIGECVVTLLGLKHEKA